MDRVVAILQGDMAHILEDEIPHITDPYVHGVPIKGPTSWYILPDGSYEVDPENPGVRRFIRKHLLDVSRVLQRVKAYGGTFSGPKARIAVPDVVIVGQKCGLSLHQGFHKGGVTPHSPFEKRQSPVRVWRRGPRGNGSH